MTFIDLDIINEMATSVLSEETIQDELTLNDLQVVIQEYNDNESKK